MAIRAELIARIPRFKTRPQELRVTDYPFAFRRLTLKDIPSTPIESFFAGKPLHFIEDLVEVPELQEAMRGVFPLATSEGLLTSFVVSSSDGIIATAAHGISGDPGDITASETYIDEKHTRLEGAKILYRSDLSNPQTDHNFALIQSPEFVGQQEIPWANTDAGQRGSPVFMIGYPEVLPGVTKALIGGTVRGYNRYGTHLWHDAQGSNGVSGGPVVNLKGEVVGISIGGKVHHRILNPNAEGTHIYSSALLINRVKSVMQQSGLQNCIPKP